MSERLISGLVIVLGCVAVSVGMALAGGRVRFAGKIHRKTATWYETMPDGWHSWFVGGFSELALGTHWVRALLVFAGWMAAGIFLMALGLRLVWPA